MWKSLRVTLPVEKFDWTYEDYCSLPDDGYRYEVIDGRLYVSPSPRTWHQVLSRRIQDLLYDLEKAGQGFVFNAPMDLLMPGCTPVQPDLIFLDSSQVGQIKEKFLEGVPRLLVEIISPKTSAYDRVVKLNRYARSGLPNYWIVDPWEQTFQVLQLSDNCYRVVAALSSGDSFEFEGINFVMDKLFAPIAGAQLEG